MNGNLYYTMKGGTGTAVSSAIFREIPVFNFRYEDGRQDLLEYFKNDSNIHQYIEDVFFSWS